MSNISTTPSDIRIEVVKQFELGGLKIEAVYVTYRGAGRFLIKDAIRAADVDGQVIKTEQQWQRIYADRANTPSDLEDSYLVTARPHPDHPSFVSGSYCTNCDEGEWWEEELYSLEEIWRDYALVLRLCA